MSWYANSAIVRELVWTLRRIAGAPLSSVLIVAALAIGLTSVTCVFTVVKKVLLEPLPYREPDRLVRIWQDLPLDTGPLRAGLSLEAVLHLQSSSATLESIAVFSPSEVSLTQTSESRSLPSAEVSPSLCRVLGVDPVLGRCFPPEEELAANPFVAVVTLGLWRELFGEAESLVGQSLELTDGGSLEIVGVLPGGFAFPELETRVWVPALHQSSNLGGYHVPTIARLKPGATSEQAAAEVGGLVPVGQIVVRSVYEDMVAEVRPRLLLLFAAVILVLAISCANVAAVLLSQMESRVRDFSILTALGAETRTLFRRTFVEALIHCAAAAGISFCLAYPILKWFVGRIPVRIPRLEVATVDGWALLLSFLCALLISLLFGWLPLAVARSAGGPNAGSRGFVWGAGGRQIRWAILLGQSILLLTLLNSASLLARSFYLLIATDPGFVPAKLLSFRVELAREKFGTSDSQVQVLRDLVERIQGLHGVKEVGVSGSLPLTSERSMASLFVSGSDSREAPVVNVSVASGGYLRALGTPILEGRLFQDTEGDRRFAAVVSRALAWQYLNGEALGKEIGFGPSGDRRRIVGVVDDVKYSGLNLDAPRMVYLPFPADLTAKPSFSRMYIAVRVSEDPLKVAGLVQSVVESLGSDVRVEDFGLMEDRVRNSVADRRFWTVLLSGVAVVGLTLTVIGIYGLTGLAVTLRTREIGIRMAIGATPFGIAKSLLSEVFAIAAASVVPAWVATQFSSRLLAGLLYGVNAADSVAFLASIAILAIASAAGSLTAVRRAVSIDPALVLRHQA